MENKETSGLDLAKLIAEASEQMKKWKVGDEITYPLTIEGLEFGKAPNLDRLKPGTPVAIRPCSEAKTFFGIYVGSFSVMAPSFGFNIETKKIRVMEGATNPAIFVPDLGKIVWGYASWWGEIRDEAHMKEITDDTIQNLWYVKAMKAMAEKQSKPEAPAQA